MQKKKQVSETELEYWIPWKITQPFGDHPCRSHNKEWPEVPAGNFRVCSHIYEQFRFGKFDSSSVIV
jgi:hypothetical protein